MYLITTKKASGVISGMQTSENGQIEWSRQMPPHCQLSEGLKRLMTPLLAGLLEVNTQLYCKTFSSVLNFSTFIGKSAKNVDI